MTEKSPQPKKSFAERVKDIEQNPQTLRLKLLVEAARRTRDVEDKVKNANRASGEE